MPVARTVRWVASGAVAASFGLLSEHLAVGWDWEQPLFWLPDLLTGWVVLTCAVRVGLRTSRAAPGQAARTAARRARSGTPRGTDRPEGARGVATLLLLTGFTWYLANVVPVAVFWHRGPLVHLLVAGQPWRPGTRARTGAVALGYATAAVPVVWGNGPVAGPLAATFVAVAVLAPRDPERAPPGVTRRRIVLAAASFWAATVIGAALARELLPPGEAAVPVLLAYEIAVCGVAISLATEPVPSTTAQVTDLLMEVIDLPPIGFSAVRDALRRSVGDPTLEIGWWEPRVGAYLTPEGQPVRLPQPGEPRVATRVDADDGPSAVLVHDGALLARVPLVEAVAAAGRLTAAHASLRAQLHAQTQEVRRSRRRLLAASDDERRKLRRQVEDGPERRLARLQDRLRGLESARGGAAAHLASADALLTGTLDDLRELARGMAPRELDDGLAAALRAIVERSPVPATLVAVPVERYPPGTETAVYYATAEALTNVVKHAGATCVRVSVQRIAGGLLLTVADDGTGGAEVGRGSGLVGLSDRVEALGGRLRITSPPGAGTTLAVELPLTARVDGPASN